MRKSMAILVVLLDTSALLAGGSQTGRVVAVDKKSFTIKPDAGKNMTFTYDSDMGNGFKGPINPRDPNSPRHLTPDEIKVDMIVRVLYMGGKDKLVCHSAISIVEHLGKREIDFTPLLAKGKDKLPEFVLRIDLQSRESLGSFRPQTLDIYFNEGASIKEVRDCVKGILSSGSKWNQKLVYRLTTRGVSDRKWKVKEVGETKLLIESYRKGDKDEPVNLVEIEAKGFPKERQPQVRLVDPRDPTKSLKSGKDERAAPKKERK